MKRQITEYIKFVLDHPLEDMFRAGEQMLPQFTAKKDEDIVVPEITKLTPAKRSLVKRIIKDKTGRNVVSASDVPTGFIKIKDENSKTLDKMPKDLSIIKWLFK